MKMKIGGIPTVLQTFMAYSAEQFFSAFFYLVEQIPHLLQGSQMSPDVTLASF